MEEVEGNEIRCLNDRLDAIHHQQVDLSLVETADKYAEPEEEKATLEAEVARLREAHSQKLSREAQKLMKMPFRRAITKKEQADMGRLKKSVRGLVVVHPMTALSREMGLQETIGFSKTVFQAPQTTGSITSARIWLALAGQCGGSPVYSLNYRTIHPLYIDLLLADILEMHFYRNSHL